MDVISNLSKRKFYRKKIFTSLAGLGCATCLASIGNANTYNTTVNPSVTTLVDGDRVETTNQEGILDTSSSSPGVQIPSNGKITVSASFDQSAPAPTVAQRSAIYLSNGITNQLGTGTEVTASFSGPAYAGINRTFDGIYLGSTSSLNANQLTLTVSSTNPDVNSLNGIFAPGNVDLGSNSQVNVTSNGLGSVTGLMIQKNLTADHFTLNVAGPSTIGIYAAGAGTTIDLGTGSAINSLYSGTATGIYIISAGSLVADQLGITLQHSSNTGSGGEGMFLNYSGAPSSLSVNLKDNSSIFTYGTRTSGIYAWNSGVLFQANGNLTIETRGAESQGFVAQSGAVANLGTSASITTWGNTNQSASNIPNYSSAAVMARGGTITIGDNSSLTTHGNGYSMGLFLNGNGSIVTVGDNVKISTYGTFDSSSRAPFGILSLTGSPIFIAGKKLHVTTYGNGASGILTQNASTMDLGQNATIATFGSDASALEIYTTATLIADGAKFITAQSDSDAIVAGGTTVTTLTGTSGATTISAANGTGMALNMSASSQLIGTGVMNILGNIKNLATSQVNLTFDPNSYLLGSWVTDATATGNLTLNGNSLWDMTSNSNLTNLTLNGGKVQFSGNDFYTLTPQNMSGNGTLGLRADIGIQQGDLVNVLGSSGGNYLLSIRDYGNQPTDSSYEHLVVQTADGVGEFSLAHPVDAGAWRYGLHRGGGTDSPDNWYLYKSGEITPAADAAINDNRASYLLNYSEIQTLLLRMGDIRKNPDQGNVWAKVNFGEYDVNQSGYSDGFHQTFKGFQAGGDGKRQWGSADVYLGATAGFNRSNQSYSEGKGSIDSKFLGAYGTYIHPSGFYTDVALKFGWQDQEFRVRDSGGYLVTNEISTRGIWGTAEVGKTFPIGKKGWYLKPQIQIGLGHQSGEDSVTSSGTDLYYNSYDSVIGRLGLVAGYEIKKGENPINLYAKASYIHEFDGRTAVTIGSETFRPDLGNSWWVYGVGVTARVKDKHNLYLDIERSTGGKFTQLWKFNAGYRFQW